MPAKINCVCDLCGAGFQGDDPYGSATCPGCGLPYSYHEGMWPELEKRHWQLLRDFTGPDADTPLADLTDEQWRGLGFFLGENVNANPAWYLPRATLRYHVTNEELWYSIVAMREVTTLGRLRHLLAALGQGDRKHKQSTRED